MPKSKKVTETMTRDEFIEKAKDNGWVINDADKEAAKKFRQEFEGKEVK